MERTKRKHGKGMRPTRRAKQRVHERIKPVPVQGQGTPVAHPCSLAKFEVTAADAAHPPGEILDLEGGRTIATIPSVFAALAEAGDAGCGEVWLWCLHCCRFFQAKHLALDFMGNWQRCPFDDCQAAGFDVDILHWTNGKTDRGWPKAESELHLGLEYPPGPQGIRAEECAY